MSVFRLSNLTLVDLFELAAKHLEKDPTVADYGMWFDVYGVYDKVAELNITVMSDKNLLLTHTPVLSHTKEQMKVLEFLNFLGDFLREFPQYSTYYMWRELSPYEMSEPLMDFEVCPGELFEAIIR
jgi:hypothetical protein